MMMGEIKVDFGMLHIIIANYIVGPKQTVYNEIACNNDRICKCKF